MGKPGLKLEDVFKETARRVAAITHGKQDPWINSSIKGDFYFNQTTTAKTAAPATPSASDRPGDNSAELLFWESIKDSRNQAVFHAYLAQYPTGPFATLARLKLEELKPRQTANLQPPTVQVTETDARYVALKTANVRAGPSTTAAKQGKLTKDSGVTVTGEVAGGKWLRIERP
ncbi:MAG: SH3 domain-containing protein, partial [Rhodospirillaceae bacterium]|nr:SH3 domain-containing protein [Rhodospirillaceae bacterium]